MSCPFFKEDYIGFCGASDFPYIPSIIELEQTCFKDSFKSCVNFNNLLVTENNRTCEFNTLKAT
jgi:hypothetical protein